MKKYGKILLVSTIMLIVATWHPSQTSAQSVVYEVLEDDGAEFSIVRHYKDNVDIVFDILVSNYRFSYVDRGTGSSITVRVPVGMAVHDFRIADDTVYFCGNYNGDALVGWFGIYDVFTLGGNIHYTICNQFVPSEPHQNYFVRGRERLLGFDRMRVLKEYGATHLLMTGAGMYIDTINNTLHYPSLIADFWTCGNNIWKLVYEMEYFEEYTFDDIAVTEDYVIVTAQNLTHFQLINTHDLIAYQRYTSENICQSIFWIQDGFFDGIVPMPIYYTYLSIMQMASPISIEAMGGNYFATVCSANIPSSGLQTVVSLYGSPTLPPLLRVADNFPVFCGYRELAYNIQNQSLYMMPVYPDNQIRYIAPPYTSIVTSEVVTSPHIWFSLHYVAPGRCIVSGSRSDLSSRTLWLFDEQLESECTAKETLPVEEIEKEQNYVNHEQILNEYIPEWRLLPTDPVDYPIVKICE